MAAKVFFSGGGWVAMGAGLLLSLSGCGSGDKQAVAAGGATAHSGSHGGRKHASAAQPGELPLAEMVAAVSSSSAGPPIEMRFSLPTRPEVGQPLDIDVAVIPRAPVPDSVSVSFQVVDGLEIIDGSELQRVEKLVDGSPIRHVVRVVPKRDGIFALTAVASFAVANQDVSRTFSIPVIAGEGMPEQVAKGP